MTDSAAEDIAETYAIYQANVDYHRNHVAQARCPSHAEIGAAVVQLGLPRFTTVYKRAYNGLTFTRRRR